MIYLLKHQIYDHVDSLIDSLLAKICKH